MSSRIAQRMVWRRFDRQRWSNAYVANIPGPPESLGFAAPLEEVFPIAPIMGNLTIGVGAMSYAGQFNITVVADDASCPDLEVFTAAIGRSLQELSSATA